MIKKNKVQIILSSIVTLLPMLAGLIMWNILPDRMSTHWGMSGEADGFSSKVFIVFGLPLIMLAGQWLCVFITARDPRNKDQSSKVFGMILWIIPIESLIINGMVYAIALGSTESVDVWVRVPLGLMFIVLGNYLPKCKQNHTIGVKVTWTLQNEENWNKTHRFTGRVWVLGGVVILATVFIPMENIMWGFLAVIVLCSFLPMFYSYGYYRKQLKAGTFIRKDEVTDPDTKVREKKMTMISIVISILVLVFVGIILFMGDITVVFEDTAFTIETGYWEDLTVDYSKIDSIEYRVQDDPGMRTYGFGSMKLLMGNFENEEFGSYIRYSYIDCESCIVLRSEDEILVINCRDEESTRQIYEELQGRIIE